MIKKKLLTIDSNLGYVLQKLLYKIKFRNNYLLDLSTIKMEIYALNYSTEFADLCDKYNSDKGTNLTDYQGPHDAAHNYSNFYQQLFHGYRDYVFNILECGIGTTNSNFKSNMTSKGSPGASLRVLRDFFPNANVIGLDIDSDVLFNEHRIKTFQVDQTSSDSIREFIKLNDQIEFDLIIDDGLHTYEASINFFENVFDRLSNNGIYIIEDVRRFELIHYLRYFATKDFSLEIVVLHRKHIGIDDNNLVVIRKNRLPSHSKFY